jgi:nicotinate dehydrogenase subunit B
LSEHHSRREFLKGSGALVVSFSVGGAAGPLVGEVSPAKTLPVPGDQLDSWIAIDESGLVTAYTGKCELGQGLKTAQAQLVAEELGVDVDQVTLIQCDTDQTPDQGTTSGSQSHPTNFNDENLGQAAATAREALVRLASQRLGVPIDRLEVQNGMIFAGREPSQQVGYGSLIRDRRFDLTLDPSAQRRRPNTWTVLGTNTHRVDIPALVSGQFEFVHNVRLPEMLHGAVVRPPAIGATFGGVDESSLRDLPGIVKIVVKRDFVGVVADRPWQAMQGAERLAVTWSGGSGLPPHGDLYERLRQQPAQDTLVVDSGDVDETLSAATSTITATYHHPYQMHGSLGTSCAVADVRTDTATVWSATQAVHPLKSTLAMLLGISPEGVRVIFRRGSGCYGINGADTAAYDAVLLSQAVGRPVRVQLSRRDEMAWENYGHAYVIDQRVGVGASGEILTWDYEAWFPRRGGRPGRGTPGNIVTGVLAGFEPTVPAPRTPPPSPTGRFRNGSNAAPSYVAGCIGGTCGGTGTVQSERVLTHTVESPFFTGPLRSPSRLQNTFAHECLMDEVAARVGADPVAYRLDHLSDPRLREVVQAAALQANWQTRPSPRSGLARSGVVTGRGFACALYEGDNGYCAMVADIDLDQDSGSLAVTHFTVSVDCGPISNPDGLRNQVEGGALQGMSRALLEEVIWDDEQVTSVDWRTYRSLSLGFKIPEFTTVILDRDAGEAMGAGETAITLVAAALGNAIFDATGTRIREVPFTRDRIKTALDATRRV